MAKKRSGSKRGKLNPRLTKQKQSTKALDALMARNAKKFAEEDKRKNFPKQYDRVFQTLVDKNVPRARALELTRTLSEINASYMDGAINAGDRDAMFYDDFYEPLDEYYDIDFHEAYQGEV